MWLFLATEVMFFTGLIGSYIVLRAGSPHTAYSNIYLAGRPRSSGRRRQGHRHPLGRLERARVEEILRTEAGLGPTRPSTILHAAPHGIVPGRPAAKAEALEQKLRPAGASSRVRVKLQTYAWPAPTMIRSTRWRST